MDAKEWLRKYLTIHTKANVRDLSDAAKGFGIQKRELKNAKIALGIVVTSDWVKGYGAENWYWSLPGKED